MSTIVEFSRTIDLRVIEKRPVATIEVLDVVRVVAKVDRGVLSANGPVIDMKITSRMAANGDASFLKAKRLFFDAVASGGKNGHWANRLYWAIANALIQESLKL